MYESIINSPDEQHKFADSSGLSLFFGTKMYYKHDIYCYYCYKVSEILQSQKYADTFQHSVFIYTQVYRSVLLSKSKVSVVVHPYSLIDCIFMLGL